MHPRPRPIFPMASLAASCSVYISSCETRYPSMECCVDVWRYAFSCLTNYVPLDEGGQSCDHDVNGKRHCWEGFYVGELRQHWSDYREPNWTSLRRSGKFCNTKLGRINEWLFAVILTKNFIYRTTNYGPIKNSSTGVCFWSCSWIPFSTLENSTVSLFMLLWLHSTLARRNIKSDKYVLKWKTRNPSECCCCCSLSYASPRSRVFPFSSSFSLAIHFVRPALSTVTKNFWPLSRFWKSNSMWREWKNLSIP